jgi:hypothetical protein
LKRPAMYLMLSLTVTGCLTHPLILNSLTPARRDDVYDCARERVIQMGYVATIDNKEAGILSARRQTRVRDLGRMGGNAQYDELTVTVSRADSAMHKIQVTAGRAYESHTPYSASRTERGPGDKVQGEAQALLNACTEAAIKRGPEIGVH